MALSVFEVLDYTVFMFSENLRKLAESVVKVATEKHVTISTAESCTGGLIAGLLTDISGSSAVVDRGFVTYSNHAKMEMVGVDQQTLNNFGAVSEQVVIEMAEGACKMAGTEIAVAVSGVAGPTGGTDEKPVGLVHIAVCYDGSIRHSKNNFDGDRNSVRMQTVEKAIIMMRDALYE